MIAMLTVFVQLLEEFCHLRGRGAQFQLTHGDPQLFLRPHAISVLVKPMKQVFYLCKGGVHDRLIN